MTRADSECFQVIETGDIYNLAAVKSVLETYSRENGFQVGIERVG